MALSISRDQIRFASAWACAGAAAAVGASATIVQVFFARFVETLYAIGHREGAIEAVRAVGSLHGLEVMRVAVWAMSAVGVALAVGALFLGRGHAGVRWPAFIGVAFSLWALWRQVWLEDMLRWS